MVLLVLEGDIGVGDEVCISKLSIRVATKLEEIDVDLRDLRYIVL